MAIERPTPPTPPTPLIENSTPKIDAHKLFQVPFQREESTEYEVPAQDEVAETPAQNVHEHKSKTPEEMAREAVANGAGALTKRTVIEPAQQTAAASKNQQVITLPPDSLVTEAEHSRGKEILSEFEAEETQQSTATPQTFTINRQESHGGLYWLVMLVVIGVLSFIVVKKFLLTDKPVLKKSDLFEDSSARLKNVADKVSKFDNAPSKKSARVPNKDDDKGKHFEVRV